MSTPTPSLSEQPVTPTPEVPTPSEQQGPPDFDATINELNSEQLLQLLNGEKPDLPAKAAETPPVETPEEVIPEEEEEETPVAAAPEVPTEPAPTPGETHSKKRISIRTLPQEQQEELTAALDLVRNGQAPDVASAILSMRGHVTPAAETAEQAVTPANPQAAILPASEQLITLEVEIADLRAQRDEAAENFDTKESNRLSALIEDKVGERAYARTIAEQQAVQATIYADKYDAAVDQLEQDYPEVLDESSNFYQLLKIQVTAAEATNDPVLKNPEYILEMGKKLHGILNPKAAAPAPIPSKPAAKTTAGTSLAPSRGTAPRHTKESFDAVLNNAKPEDLLAALNQLG